MKQRIALATIALDRMAGGIERNIVLLANYLAERGIDTHLLSFDLPGAVSFFSLDSRVAWHKLGHTQPHQSIGFWDRLKLLARMRKLMLQDSGFDYVICFHHGVLVRYVLATIFSRVAIVCSERNSLQLYDHIKRRKKWNLNFLMLFLAKKITVQFPGYKNDYPCLLRSKINTVHNPVMPAAGEGEGEGEGRREKIILSVGRHSAQKRFDLLIRACHRVFRQYPDWRLIIVGDGQLTPQLTGLVEELGMGEQVELMPPVKDLNPLYRRARFYCQPSQWEGFPNAQAEAMAAGAIPVGFASTKGVADLIEHGVNGVLCPGDISPDNLAGAIIKAMGEPDAWPRMSLAAREVSRTYSMESWRKCWDKVLGL
jgi:glycosyltransferase involved in cell wall biosynthesis